MKKFNEWLLEKHPEMINEGLLDSLGKNKFIRRGVAGLGLAAGAAGLYGAGHSAGSNQSNRSNMQQSEDEFDKFDRDNGLDDETINRQLNKLPGTYEAGIRTFDEKGRKLQLTPKEQNRVDSIRKIRSQRIATIRNATCTRRTRRRRN
jgi:hypothetical protein